MPHLFAKLSAAFVKAPSFSATCFGAPTKASHAIWLSLREFLMEKDQTARRVVKFKLAFDVIFFKHSLPFSINVWQLP
jgi:hypothetical protein